MAKGGKKGQTRAKKTPGVLRFVLAANLKAQLAKNYPGMTKTEAEKKLAAACGLSPSSIQRLAGGATGASLDSIEAVAGKLKVSVTDLLTPSTEMRMALNIREEHAPTSFPGKPSGEGKGGPRRAI